MEGVFNVLLIGLVLILMLAAVKHSLSKSHTQLPIVSQPILTEHEIIFVEKLIKAVSRLESDLTVFPQVAMSAFLAIKPGTTRELRAKTFNRFSRKRPDFVLVDKAMNVALIVELDDKTHNAKTDAQRDQIAAAAGIQTVRFRNGRRITINQIVEGLAPHLRCRQNNQTWGKIESYQSLIK